MNFFFILLPAAYCAPSVVTSITDQQKGDAPVPHLRPDVPHTFGTLLTAVEALLVLWLLRAWQTLTAAPEEKTTTSQSNQVSDGALTRIPNPGGTLQQPREGLHPVRTATAAIETQTADGFPGTLRPIDLKIVELAETPRVQALDSYSKHARPSLAVGLMLVRRDTTEAYLPVPATSACS